MVYCIVTDGIDHTTDRNVPKPDVAVKKFLNYLRWFTQSRPKAVFVLHSEDGKLVCQRAEVAWYRGQLKDAILKTGDEGEWYELVGISDE